MWFEIEYKKIFLLISQTINTSDVQKHAHMPITKRGFNKLPHINLKHTYFIDIKTRNLMFGKPIIGLYSIYIIKGDNPRDKNAARIEYGMKIHR